MERLKEARSQHPRALGSPSSYRWPSGAGGLPGMLAPQLALADPPRQKPCSPQRGHRRDPGQRPPGRSGSRRARLARPQPVPAPRRFLLHVRFRPKTQSRRTGRTRQVRPGPWPHAVPTWSLDRPWQRGPPTCPGSVSRALRASARPPAHPPILLV